MPVGEALVVKVALQPYDGDVPVLARAESAQHRRRSGPTRFVTELLPGKAALRVAPARILGRLHSSVPVGVDHESGGFAAPARRRRTAPLLVFLASAWTACEGPGSSVAPASTQPTVSVTTASRADDITLSGRVTAAYGAHIFVVGSGNEQVIVVAGTPAGASVGSDVEVTGRVTVFRRRELEADLGVDLGPAADELENDSCLVASAVRLR